MEVKLDQDRVRRIQYGVQAITSFNTAATNVGDAIVADVRGLQVNSIMDIDDALMRLKAAKDALQKMKEAWSDE